MKKINYLIFVSSLFFTLSSLTFAAPLNEAQLLKIANKYLETYGRDEHISAVQLTVKLNGKAPISVSAGSRVYNKYVRVNNNTLFQVGSITKSFIAAIILQLEADPAYQFSIDDTLDKLLPQYPRWKQVTVRQLMNMTSGIPAYSDQQIFFDTYKADPFRDLTPELLVGMVSDKDLLFKPGQGWNYSNTNYSLLGMIIEKLTGHTLAQEISTRLIKPFHLTHTFYMPYKADPALLSNMVHGYFYSSHLEELLKLQPGTDTTMYSLWGGPSGAMVSTAGDIARWVNVLYTSGQVLNEKQYKKLIELVSMKTGKPLPYPVSKNDSGFGLGIVYSYIPAINKYVYYYKGTTFGSRGFYIYEPKSKVIISATFNSGVDEDHITDLLAEVYKLLNDSHYNY